MGDVYCGECKYKDNSGLRFDESQLASCKHHKVIFTFKSWDEKIENERFPMCAEKNKDNDCPDFAKDYNPQYPTRTKT